MRRHLKSGYQQFSLNIVFIRLPVHHQTSDSTISSLKQGLDNYCEHITSFEFDMHIALIEKNASCEVSVLLNVL